MSNMMPSVPHSGPALVGFMDHMNEFLDKHVLPYPVKYLTNRITILATLSLLVPLIALANVTVFVLAANSYLNVMSVVVSSTVLLYSTLSEARDKEAAKRREEIAEQHQRMVDERAKADSERIQEIHDHLDDIHKEVMTHVTVSLDNIQKILTERLEKIQDEDQNKLDEAHSMLMSNMAAHREEIANLSKVVESLRPGGPKT